MRTPRHKLEQRWSAIKNERSSFITHWREISDYVMPRSARFYKTDRNRGGKKHNAIFDNTGSQALKILAAGMMAGMSSPARPWFRLSLPDDDLMENPSVKVWLADTQRRMLNVFARSNTYLTLHSVYEELAAFGTSAVIMMDDFERTIHHYHSPIGEFGIATNYKGDVNTCYREFEKTVGELVGEFGYDACSRTVRKLHDAGNVDSWIPIIHAIEPRVDRDPNMRDSKNKAFKSCYFEASNEDGKDNVLRESGYDTFPVMAPRWHRMGGDIYGSSPAMEALGDIKQLQHEQLRKANGIDYMTKPPLQVPSSMKQREVDYLPAGVTYVDQTGPQNSVRTLFDVNINLDHLLMDIQDVRGRIRSSFHADMFLMLSGGDTSRMTATEVAERHEEKMLMLGPVLERLQNELLKPLIDETFTKMVKTGNIMPPPEELQGVDLDVEFVSMLAQAQKAVGVNSVDRFTSNLGMIAQMKPDVLDKIDTDTWADKYSDMLGVDPDLIVSNENVAIVRQQRAEAQQQEQQMMNIQAQADAAQKLGTVKTNESNAASDILNMFSGYQTPSGVEV